MYLCILLQEYTFCLVNNQEVQESVKTYIPLKLLQFLISCRRWDVNEPNNVGEEDCVEIYTNGLWNDQTCTEVKGLICDADTSESELGQTPLIIRKYCTCSEAIIILTFVLIYIPINNSWQTMQTDSI